MTWDESQIFAQSRNGRLPTKSEAKEIAQNFNIQGDMWVPVGTKDNKDWIQIAFGD